MIHFIKLQLINIIWVIRKNASLNMHTNMNNFQKVAISINGTRIERDMIINKISIAIGAKYSSLWLLVNNRAINYVILFLLPRMSSN